MANFEITNPVFNGLLRKLEASDPNHADTFNNNFRQLIENEQALHSELAAKANQTDLNTTNENIATNTADILANTNSITTHTSQIASLASGAPKAVSLVSQMTDTTKSYVYTGSEGGYTAGHWYYHNGSIWVSGGVYQSSAIGDGTVKPVSTTFFTNSDNILYVDSFTYAGSLPISNTDSEFFIDGQSAAGNTLAVLFSVTPGQQYYFEADVLSGDITNEIPTTENSIKNNSPRIADSNNNVLIAYDSATMTLDNNKIKGVFTCPTSVCKFLMFVNSLHTFNSVTLGLMLTVDAQSDYISNKRIFNYPVSEYTSDNIRQVTLKYATIKTYYLSENGNDDNDGLSPFTPKKTLGNFSGLSDYVLYLFGGDSFKLTDSFVLGDNVKIIGFHGKPIIDGYSDVITSFTHVSGNIYSKPCLKDVGHLLIDSRDVSWKKVVTYGALLNDDEFYYDDANDLLYILKQNINNYDIQFAYNFDLFKDLVLRENITINNIEFTGSGRHGINGVFKNSQFTNNSLKNIGGCLSADLTVRLGNAIQIWGNGSENVIVEHNKCENVYDAGITFQINSSGTLPNSDIIFRKNICVDCFYPIEHFNDTTNDCINILYEKNLLIRNTNTGYRIGSSDYTAGLTVWYSNGTNDDVKFKYNIIVNASSYFISAQNDLSKVTFEDNIFVTNNTLIANIKNPQYVTNLVNNVMASISSNPLTDSEYARCGYYKSLAHEKIVEYFE